LISKNEFKIKLLNQLWRICSKKNEQGKWICGYIKLIEPDLTPEMKYYLDQKRNSYYWTLIVKYKHLTIEVLRSSAIEKGDTALSMVNEAINRIRREILEDKKNKIEKKENSYRNKNSHLPKGNPNSHHGQMGSFWSAGGKW